MLLQFENREDEIRAELPGTKKSVPGVITNPAFDPRIIARPMKQKMWDNTSFLRRGFIQNSFAQSVKTNNLSSGSTKVQLNFLYNPSVLSLSHSGSLDSTILPQAARPGDVGMPIVDSNASFTFSLLFDRTYELYDEKYRGTVVGYSGVWADIVQAYRLVGIINMSQNNVKQLETGSGLVSPMQYILQRFYFGDASYGIILLGVINSLSIDITHWNQNMTPQRCTMAISATMIPNIDSAANGG